jgi:hypothetical protein
MIVFSFKGMAPQHYQCSVLEAEKVYSLALGLQAESSLSF